MYFDKEFLEKIKSSVDLFELIKEFAPDLKYTTPDIAQCRCPHPNHSEDNPSFMYKKSTNTWNCYGCHSHKNKNNGNEGSDCIGFIRWIKDMTFHQAVVYLANRQNIPLPNSKNQSIYDNNYKLAIEYIKNLKGNKQVLEYLYSRGLNDEDLKEWMIGYNVYENRIVFPLMDNRENIVGFNRRLITKESKNIHMKYIHPSNSEIFNKSKYLYGLHNINKKVKYIIITEGVMDVILATKYNVPNVVCTLGTSLQKEHIDIIKNYGLEPIIIYDNDASGQDGIKRAFNLLIKENIYCKACILPNGYDLADTCLQYKSASRQFLEQYTYTYGYLQIKDIIDTYYKRESEIRKIYDKKVYEIKLDLQPILEEKMKQVPELERKSLENFLYEEIRIRP